MCLHTSWLYLQDIVTFRGSLEELNILNEAGRSKLSALRKCIERLDDYAADLSNPDLAEDVDTHRQQFSRYTIYTLCY